jgi:hypothetical protein
MLLKGTEALTKSQTGLLTGTLSNLRPGILDLRRISSIANRIFKRILKLAQKP